MTDSISNGASQYISETQVPRASADLSGEAVQSIGDTQCSDDSLATLIAEIRETYRFYTDFMRAQVRMELQIQSVCRRLCDGDKTEGAKLRKSMTNGKAHLQAEVAFGALAPMLSARDMLTKQQSAYEKALVKVAKKLPVYPWAQGIRGFGDASLGKVIGETGDLTNYDTVSKLWKRMGLAVVDGQRQRRVSGSAALDHGYSPQRRSLMWTIGDCVIRAQIRKGEDEGPSTAIAELGEYYLERKEKDSEKFETAGHLHNHAKRLMEKRLLRDLWRAWRDA